MSSRVFQSVVLQMKEHTNRIIGVIDHEGTVVACNELSSIGEKWFAAAEAAGARLDSVTTYEGYTFKPLTGLSAQLDYAVFVQGEDEQAHLICSLAAVALNGAKAYYEEKHDKTTFVKNIISDNILPGDIYTRAKELHFLAEQPRAVFLIRQVESADPSAIEVLYRLFPDRQVDYVLSISEGEMTLVKQVSEGVDGKDLYKIAKQIEDALFDELKITVVIGIGTVVNHVRELARAYKEAGVAIAVGKVFDTEKSVINYENLGIGRLIYQLPTTFC